MWSEPQFDPHAFAGRKSRIVSAETGISFNDREYMHVKHFKIRQERKHPTPEWAMDDTTLRRRVLTFLEQRFYLPSGEAMSDSDRLAVINKASKARLPRMRSVLERLLAAYNAEVKAGASDARLRRLRINIQNRDTDVVITQRGIAAIIIAVVYHYYRIGWNSVQIAEQFGIKPSHVRIMLYRLSRPDSNTHLVGDSDWPADKLKALFFLRARGLTLTQCAKVFKTCPSVVTKHWNAAFPEVKTRHNREQRPRRQRKPDSRRAYRGPKRGWTNEEISLVKELHEKHCLRDICARLRRSQSSVAYIVAKHIRHTR